MSTEKLGAYGVIVLEVTRGSTTRKLVQFSVSLVNLKIQRMCCTVWGKLLSNYGSSL